MNKIYLLFFALISILVVSCNSNHASEFRKIAEDDVEGYEQFIVNYPNSALVSYAQEMLEVAKKRRGEIQAELELLYGNNSLSTGEKPYAAWFPADNYMDDYTPHSEIKVTASENCDVVVIVKFDDNNGKVAGHAYIKAGETATIYLENGYDYQTFFYTGRGWYPDKEMVDEIKGGFIKGAEFFKDDKATKLSDTILSYTLSVQLNGNFNAAECSEAEFFL